MRTGAYGITTSSIYNEGAVYFKNKEDAQAVIDNPNFKTFLMKSTRINVGGLGMKTFVFDVMLDGRFVCTLKYKYCALFPIDFEELEKYVLQKRPTLKGKDFRIAF